VSDSILSALDIKTTLNRISLDYIFATPSHDGVSIGSEISMTNI